METNAKYPVQKSVFG